MQAIPVKIPSERCPFTGVPITSFELVSCNYGENCGYVLLSRGCGSVSVYDLTYNPEKNFAYTLKNISDSINATNEHIMISYEHFKDISIIVSTEKKDVELFIILSVNLILWHKCIVPKTITKL